MYDIFLSYSTEDRERLKPLVNALDQQGWSVFWDHRSIPVGKNWRMAIGEAVANCRCMVVAWSEASVQSKWVQEEAIEGSNRGVLFPILLDQVELPFGFRLIQAADLSDWRGKANHSECEALLHELKAFLGEPIADPKPAIETAIPDAKPVATAASVNKPISKPSTKLDSAREESQQTASYKPTVTTQERMIGTS